MLVPALREFATDRQWEILSAIESEGSEVKAAKKLGCVKSNVSCAVARVKQKAAKHG